jgi:hypothetical protein
MDIVAIAKKTVSFVVAVGVSKIVHDVIENNVEPENTAHKVAVPVASFAIGGAVAGAASTYTDGFIDEIVELVAQFKKAPKPELKIVKD